MKRIKNIWENVLNKNNAYVALVEGTREKRTKREVQKLLFSPEEVADDPTKYHVIDPAKGMEYVDGLINRLRTKSWSHKAPRHRRCFCRNRASSHGKWRDLYVPHLDDHIIHHMIMQESMEAFTRGMHPHCCGSVPGRGIKHIVDTVSHWMHDDLQCRYFVKLDIAKFFDNITADKLEEKLSKKIKDKDMLWAHRQIIRSAQVACPVGYYPSPWYANLYLEDLDWYVEQDLYKERRGKRIKYVRHYLRYVDDILLIGTSKSDMEKAVRAIMKYLADNYSLKVKQSWEIKKIGKHEIIDGKHRLKPGTYWCDIGGYKFCKDSTILRDGIYLATKRLAKKIYKQGYHTVHQCMQINASVAWTEKCDSKKFLENDVYPYVNLKLTRRKISDVDKNRKRRKAETGGTGNDCKPCDSAKGL